MASEQIRGRRSTPELWAMGKPFYQRDVLGFAPGAEIERPRHEAPCDPRRRVRSYPRSRNVRWARRWALRCPNCGGETPGRQAVLRGLRSAVSGSVFQMWGSARFRQAILRFLRDTVSGPVAPASSVPPGNGRTGCRPL